VTAPEIAAAADQIARTRLARGVLTRLPDGLRPADEPSAYRVQAAVNRLLAAAGWGAPVGHKIGCTTPVMQAFLGIPNPCAGEVFGPTVHDGAGTFSTADAIRVGVECEIAVRVGRDVSGKLSRDEAEAAVASVHASIEVVDDRYDDYTTLGTPTLIADDFFNAGCVLGPAVRDWRGLDLATLVGRMLINGEEVGRGVGADILGHPLEALMWLAGSLAERGRVLRAGEFVTLGSLVATRWVQAGDEVRIEVEGLGGARATFT
jgi:2-oxo-3-hexenedioate decarboxylase/2-keto-4-pentenoate hydratase